MMSSDDRQLYLSRTSEVWLRSGLVEKKFPAMTREVSTEIGLHKDLSKKIGGICKFMHDQEYIPLFLMEYCCNGSLREIIQKMKENNEKFEEGKLLELFASMMETVKLIHDQRYVHLAINVDNWLVTSDLTLKLSDFGHAKRILQGESGIPYPQPKEEGLPPYDGIFAYDALLLGIVFLQMASFEFNIERHSLTKERIDQYCYGYQYNVARIIKSLIFRGNVMRQGELRTLLEELEDTINPGEFPKSIDICATCLNETGEIRNLPCCHSVCANCYKKKGGIFYCNFCKVSETSISILPERSGGIIAEDYIFTL